VESALKAKSTDTGSAALGKGYTIEAALILAEFAADEDATEELESVIRDEPDMLAHVTQQLRDRRDRAAALAALTAELEAAGTNVVATVGYDGDSENVRVTSLNRADGEQASEEDANAVAITTAYNGQHSTVPVVAGWKDRGFTLRYSGYGSSAPKGPMSEEQKAERKTLIANNKLMESATKVRRQFVKTLLAKKQAPKEWQYFTVHAITHHSETASGYEGKVAAEMAGAKMGEASDRWGWNPLRDHVAKSTARPEVSLIALVCAGYEKTIAKDSWRSPNVRHIDYLTQLITWGYTPSEVEQIILDSGKPAQEDAAE
jgi:ParB family chromosome partitioning protein